MQRAIQRELVKPAAFNSHRRRIGLAESKGLFLIGWHTGGSLLQEQIEAYMLPYIVVFHEFRSNNSLHLNNSIQK